jgi:hypothetical protein
MSRARAQIVSSFLGLGIVSTWIVGGGRGLHGARRGV